MNSCQPLSEKELYKGWQTGNIDKCGADQLKELNKKTTVIGVCPPLNPIQMMSIKEGNLCDPFFIKKVMRSRTLTSRCHSNILYAWKHDCS